MANINYNHSIETYTFSMTWVLSDMYRYKSNWKLTEARYIIDINFLSNLKIFQNDKGNILAKN